MNGTTRISLLAFGASLVALAACSDATSPTLGVSDAVISADVASDAGDAAASTLDAMVSSEALYNGDKASGAWIPTIGGEDQGNAPVVAQSVLGGANTTCSGPDASGWFMCTADKENGLTVTRSIRFWDGTSFGLKFDGSTDSVNHILGGAGTLTPSAAKTRWVNRTDTLTMVVTRAAGNIVAARTWNGHGTRSDSSLVTDSLATRVYHYTAFDTVSAIVYFIPRSANPYPQSGTWSNSVTAVLRITRGTETSTRTVTRNVAVTFNGTANVTLTVGGLTCALNLATHAVTNCQ